MCTWWAVAGCPDTGPDSRAISWAGDSARGRVLRCVVSPGILCISTLALVFLHTFRIVAAFLDFCSHTEGVLTVYVVCVDLMWSDPDEVENWAVSPRGAGWLFGGSVTQQVCRGLIIHLLMHSFVQFAYA